jgi:prolyl oligopeptidase
MTPRGGTGHEQYDRVLAILDSKEKIPYVRKINSHVYNFWQCVKVVGESTLSCAEALGWPHRDTDHKRGIWRRTTMEEYVKEDCTWETVLDLDALGESEKENWVWKSYTLLDEGPGIQQDLALLKLSRGGADAVVVREFNLNTKEFVKTNPFNLPEVRTPLCRKRRI